MCICNFGGWYASIQCAPICRTILQKVKDQSSSSGVADDPTESNSSAAVSAGEGGLVRGGVETFGGGGGNHSDILKEKPHHVNPDHISVSYPKVVGHGAPGKWDTGMKVACSRLGWLFSV